MDATKWTPEPWVIGGILHPDSMYPVVGVHDSRSKYGMRFGRKFAEFSGRTAVADAERACATVNTMVGIDDPAAYLAEAKRMAHNYACKVMEASALRASHERLVRAMEFVLGFDELSTLEADILSKALLAIPPELREALAAVPT